MRHMKLIKIKEWFNKDITDFMQKHKIPLIAGLVVFLLACIGIFVTYAFYQVRDITPIIGGSTGEIADLEVRVMAEERDTNGNGLGSYALYPYIPQAGYEMNSEKSYCTNGSEMNYNEETFDVDVTAYGHDVCYLYFDSTAQLDLTLYVYAENIDSDGYGTGEYTQLETTSLPTIGYVLNPQLSFCENGSTVSYSDDTNMFTIEASNRDVCTAYMDAIDVDIQLKLYAQVSTGSTEYREVEDVPNNAYYELGADSACTGSGNTDALSIQNQKVVIAAASKTSCVAYLDIGSGPILESMDVTNDATITLTNSNLGTNPTTYYYSTDGGNTFTESTSPSYTVATTGNTSYSFAAYSVDASGKSSAILTTEEFIFTGMYDYANYIQELTVPKTGYYLLEAWGAQGGDTQGYIGGYGGYAKGIVELTAGETLYIATGGKGGDDCTSTACPGGYNGGGSGGAYLQSAGNNQTGGGGATHIATTTGLLASLENNRDAILLVAGGGSGAYYHTNGAGYSMNGASGGGYLGNDGTVSSYGVAAGGGSQTAGGAAGYRGYAGSFGQGGNGIHDQTAGGASGGGGGYYGGGAAGHSAPGGGSGYIGNARLISGNGITKSMYCYNCATSNAADTLTYSVTTVSATATSNTAKQGNGYAKITYLGETLN